MRRTRLESILRKSPRPVCARIRGSVGLVLTQIRQHHDGIPCAGVRSTTVCLTCLRYTKHLPGQGHPGRPWMTAQVAQTGGLPQLQQTRGACFCFHARYLSVRCLTYIHQRNDAGHKPCGNWCHGARLRKLQKWNRGCGISSPATTATTSHQAGIPVL